MRLVALLFAFVLAGASAQEQPLPALRATALKAPDLAYPREPSQLTLFSGVHMALYKPEGNGPFPALVLMHQCGGLRDPRPNVGLLDWARAGVAHGYVVLVVDSLGPRKVETLCGGPRNGITPARGVRDALLAGAHLATLPYVEKDRIALAGFSWGAKMALLASGRRWADALGDGFHFRATAALYPGCFPLQRPDGRPMRVVNPDIERPLLVMMAGQDTETPASECVGRLESLQAAGAPVRWHVYPQATHCWDCRQLNGFSKTSLHGVFVVYRYDAATTRDSQQRLFDFLAGAMPHG